MSSGLPFAGGPPARQPKTESQLMWEAIGQVESNLTQIVNHINTWVAKIQGIDSVAFAALMLHGDKEFKLDEAAVAANQKKIQEVLAEMGRYREVMQAKAQAEQEAARAEAAKGIGGNLPVMDTAVEAPKETEAKDDVGATDNAKG